MVNKHYKVGAIIKRQAEDPRFFETLLSSSALKDWKEMPHLKYIFCFVSESRKWSAWFTLAKDGVAKLE
jgi:hypothetical protein